MVVTGLFRVVVDKVNGATTCTVDRKYGDYGTSLVTARRLMSPNPSLNMSRSKTDDEDVDTKSISQSLGKDGSSAEHPFAPRRELPIPNDRLTPDVVRI